MNDAMALAAVACRTAIAVLLFFSSIPKLTQDKRDFELALRRYELLPDTFVPSAARALPILEALIAVFLLGGLYMPLPAVAAMVLFTTFGIAISINLLRGRAIPCSCFGAASSTLIGWPRVLENALFVAASFAATGASLTYWQWPIAAVPVESMGFAAYVAASLTGLGLLALLALVKAAFALGTFRKRLSPATGDQTSRQANVITSPLELPLVPTVNGRKGGHV